MSVRPSVRMGQLGGFHWTDFLEIWYSSILRKYFEKTQVSLWFGRITDALHLRLWYYLAELLLEWEMTQVVEKIDTHIYVQFFPENRVILRFGFAYCITEATDAHTVYVILIAFARQQCYANAPVSLFVIIQCLSRLRLLRTFLCFRTFAVTTLPVKTVLRLHINLRNLFW
jgi:hypothetical protein